MDSAFHFAHRWELDWQDDVDVLTLGHGVQRGAGGQRASAERKRGPSPEGKLRSPVRAMPAGHRPWVAVDTR
ncbi:MAG TPA: hypothetical protein VFV13_08595, partial [Acidimicrobiia bacterium]|nr:hypothetical protein [Acidimicrobiia bacterium]